MLCFLVAVAYLIKEIINLVDEHYESINSTQQKEKELRFFGRAIAPFFFCPDKIIITQLENI